MMNLTLQLLENDTLKIMFLKLTNMSISASWLVLVVIILRFALKKAPKWVNVVMWGIVAVRLLCPFSIESALSLIPSTETIPMNIEMAAKPAIDSGIDVVNSAVNPIISASFAPDPGASANPLQIWIPVASVIWVLGMVLMGVYAAVSYLRLYRKLSTAVRYEKNIFQSENVTTPFVIGFFRPRIYLPFQIAEGDLAHVITHEQAHICRKDHWWKPLGFLFLTIHWFNPIMWLAYILLCRDIELACDEKVIQKLGNEQRADYTQALVSCSVNRRMIAVCPLAFGEVGVKDRVKTIMNYKKPAFWLIFVAIILCMIVAVCFLTDPIQDKKAKSFLDYKHVIALSERQDVIPAVHYSGENDQGSIGIGMVEGAAFAAYLETSQWAEKWFEPSDLASPGSVAVNVAENLRITIYDRNFAAVKFNDDICYYRIMSNDYQRIRDLLMPADPERLDRVSESRLELALGIATIDENDSQSEKLRLSLNDVIILSQKGYDLTWSDFDQYKYIETGFGLYIRRYEINDQFHFSIGGAGPNSSPMYMHLGVNGEVPDAFMDIRNGGVTEFIAEHKTDSAETWDRIPMVMVNGKVYLDTGKESTVTVRCGMMDGQITSQVPGSEVPAMDDQSNFGTGYGYQYGAMEGTIEICMNDKWWIFATEEVRQDIQFPEAGNIEYQSDYRAGRTLTQEEIDRINAAFEPILYDEQGNPMSTNIWTCFFTSYYDDIRDMDFAAFLMYYPGDGTTVDEKEFDALRDQENFWFKDAQNLNDMPVPVHKYSARILDLTLKEYAGITLEDLDISKVDYLAGYEAFYNYTSDYAPGIFRCTHGEIDGDLVRLYEETDSGTDMLTLRKVSDRYLVVAHQEIKKK